ncbi:MAG: amino acid permease [Acidobacteriia bacterium]|jgi:APA family basic amino acid/polyamine antiporter|nr:amino acid permease [Terriglobia bacterium]
MAEATRPASLAATTEEPQLVRGLGLLDATMLVMGSMIGSGIFIVSADIARQVPSPGGLLLVWLLTAFLTIVGALSFGELAAMMPRAGGTYVYLREAFGPLTGFLYGWTIFLVIGSATIAAVAIAFAKFAGVFWPAISADRVLVSVGTLPFLGKPMVLHTQNLLAIASIALLTWVNCRGIRTGAIVQNLFTLAKVGAVVGLVVLGLTLGRNATAIQTNFTDFWRNLSWDLNTFTALAVAMVGSLFASFAWENVTFTAGETKNPSRNIPLSLLLGAGGVMVLYLLANVVYLVTLPLEGSPQAADPLGRGIQYAAEDRVGAAAGEMILGSWGAYLMAGAILISTFGCNNGLILSYARVSFAMARDRLFFARMGRLNSRTHSPNFALAMQGVWASFLTLTGTYTDLLDYIIFAVLLFYIVAIAAVFVLRRKRPDLPRPYRAFGYPVLPFLYIAFSVFIEVCLLLYKPRYTWPGLIIVLLGVPVYLLWRRPMKAGGPAAGSA